jgi:hypothetical protein
MCVKPRLPIRALIVTLFAAVTLAACGGNAAPTKEPSASLLLPQPAGYVYTDVNNIQDFLAKLGALGSAGTGQVEIAAVISGLNGIASCYQSAGAIEGRTYVNSSDPAKVGAVLVINDKLLADAQLALTCITGLKKPNAAITINICTRHCSISQNNNTYSVYYAATDQEVCSAFDSALPACTN